MIEYAKNVDIGTQAVMQSVMHGICHLAAEDNIRELEDEFLWIGGQTMNQDAEKEFLMSVYEYRGFSPEQWDLDRNVDVTTYNGAQANLAGVVIAINGSPPKGTFLYQFGNNEIIYYFGANLDRITSSGRNKKCYDAAICFLKRKGILSAEGRVNQNWQL